MGGKGVWFIPSWMTWVDFKKVGRIIFCFPFPQVECLLECKFHTEDLSSLFLEKVAETQKTTRSKSGSEGRNMALSHQARLALWTSFLPSFKQEVNLITT